MMGVQFGLGLGLTALEAAHERFPTKVFADDIKKVRKTLRAVDRIVDPPRLAYKQAEEKGWGAAG